MSKPIQDVSAWVLFLGSVGGLIAAQLVATAAANYFGWAWEYGPYPTLRFALMILVLWIYPILVSRALSKNDPAVSRRMLAVVLLAIINNVLSVYVSETLGPLWYVILITAAINTYCLFAVISFPARSIRSIELENDATLNDYWMEFFQFMLWPLFVWWLQPRLRSALDKTANTSEQ